MKNLNFNLTEANENGNLQIDVELNGEYAGNIEFTDYNMGVVAHVENIKIESEFRGKGLYRMLLMTIFNLTSFEVIVSDNRNDYSQPIYQHWINEEIESDTMIEIRLEDENLSFEIC